ncbi:MAG: hypothetical protein U1E46_01930 [Hyphomicrobiales bacterium]
MLMKSAAAEDAAVVSAFLNRMSIEITAKQAEKLPLIAAKVPKHAHVYVALIDPADLPGQIEAVAQIRSIGLEPVPHIPARFVRDRDDLAQRLEAFAKRGKITRALVLGGGAPQPVGRYDAAIQLLETGLFQANGINAVGIAGHPEGNPDITKVHGEAALLAALKTKQAYISEHGLDGWIATQFLFEADPVAQWAAGLRREGITLPISVGIPGPATIKTLVKYAAMCGVGNSARFIRKQAMNVTKLLSVNTPDDFIAGLAKLHATRPDLGIDRPHMYPFGGFDKLFDWLTPKM